MVIVLYQIELQVEAIILFILFIFINYNVIITIFVRFFLINWLMLNFIYLLIIYLVWNTYLVYLTDVHQYLYLLEIDMVVGLSEVFIRYNHILPLQSCIFFILIQVFKFVISIVLSHTKTMIETIRQQILCRIYHLNSWFCSLLLWQSIKHFLNN